MASLPFVAVSPTVAAIWQHYESRQDAPRAHLGASVIGRPCARQLWYAFRWAYRERFEGRMLRLFERGHREESWFAEDLRAIGVTLHTVDAAGQQFRFSAVGGHVGGSMDGAGIGFPEAPKTWHVFEAKTHSAKSFTKLQAGVKVAKPEHWAQMQLYMKWSGMERAFYLAVNKDTDDLLSERIEADSAAAEALEQRARMVVEASTPPDGISKDPAWFECKFCPAAAVCHRGEGVQINCRTCLHSTPITDGDGGRWHCARHNAELPAEVMPKGCAEHRLIPALVPWATVTDADVESNVVWYSLGETGPAFSNGGPQGFTSAEIVKHREKELRLMLDPVVAGLREQMGAKVKRVKWMPQGAGVEA